MTGVLPVVGRMKLQIHLNKEVYWSVLEFIWMKRFTEAACPGGCDWTFPVRSKGCCFALRIRGLICEANNVFRASYFVCSRCIFYFFVIKLHVCNLSLLNKFYLRLISCPSIRLLILPQLQKFCNKLLLTTKFVCAFCKSSWKCDLPAMLLPPLLLPLSNCAQCWKRVPNASRYNSAVSIV
jgi:hypothetical protein